MTDYFPEKTIQYKTFVKDTMVQALTNVFNDHPDQMLNGARVHIEYPRSRAEYPSVIVRFFERDMSNAGIGHTESLKIEGETKNSEEVDVTLTGGNASVQLSWTGVDGAEKYRVYRATDPGIFDTYWETRATAFTDTGDKRQVFSGTIPTIDNAPFDAPEHLNGAAAPGGGLSPGTWRYRVTAVGPSQTFKFKHYFYTGDVEFAIYGLSSYDRDLLADTVVQTLTMGQLETYTSRFFAEIYKNPPDKGGIHVLTFNSDQVQGFGENQASVAWGEEDTLVYYTSYRVRVFGEIYSLPPQVPFGLISKVLLYPYIAGLEDVPQGLPNNDVPWDD